MRFICAAILFVLALGGCSRAPDKQNFSVFFKSYSAEIDPQAHETIHDAAAFAQANPALPVALIGYSAPPNPKLEVVGLSAQRAAMVKQALVNDGVLADRVTTTANGITDPNGLPNLSVQRVDIRVGR